MIEEIDHLKKITRIDSADLRGDYVRLDRNERVSPLPSALHEKLLELLGPDIFTSYPDPKPLNERISKVVGLPIEYVSATNGSDSAIRRIFHAFISPGDKVIVFDPSYAMYSIYTQIFQGVEVKFEYDEHRKLDLDLIRFEIESGARLICIANPDQPTGSVQSDTTIYNLVKLANRSNTIVLLDETYYPCHLDTSISLVGEFDNLLVTRSMSKVFGLAGVRLGYFCAQPRLIEAVNKVRGLHEVNSIAISLGSFMLEHPEVINQFLIDLEAGRMVIKNFATKWNLNLPSCPTNFQLIEFPEKVDINKLVNRLKPHGFLVKGGYKARSVRHCIRVTLGDADMMEQFVMAIEKVLGELSISNSHVFSDK